MYILIEQILNGVSTGAVYAIVAVGMTMIFGVLRAINFAHGEYYMLGTFGGWYATSALGLPYPAAILVGVAVTMLIAYGIGKLVMERMIGVPVEASVVATLGVSLVLQNSVILIFGGSYKFFSAGYIEPVFFGDIGIAQQRLLIILVCALVFLGLELLVGFSRIGKAMRAVSQNIEACEVVGIDVKKVVLSTFVLGTGLAAFSGVLTAPVNVSVYGGMGEIITFKTLPIIVMGGLGNVRGTLVAALILGIAETVVAGYFGLQYRDSVGFITLILMLLWRPHGLFSSKARF
ncbi:branched-chain amino acid ABC transporter permease [Phaeovulum sp. W22_SRMD_FR3]|uniref:branched-chain amino acid ABC transporter permease n=1 Tax=Phaeovulum sp. W22_SRMD_FR3 TaxID=3240274 RepID=UPI003F9AC678